MNQTIPGAEFHPRKNTTKNSYRDDIQGLRAIAVLSVLGFHINPERLPGGFTGVDIFFVISGYLITGIIWRDLERGTFSFSEFYAKRIRRLYPALFAMVAVTTVFSTFTALPQELSQLGKSMIATMFYASNFYFYTESDYFDSDLELSPLLHTWSLAVEEQFYLLFPLILFFTYRLLKRKIPFLLCALSLASFLLGVYFLNKDPSLSFYLSPTRFYQFMIGGLIALNFFISVNSKLIREIFFIAGILLLGWCALFINKYTPYPGFYALVPTFGTALIIYSGHLYKTSSQAILANPLMIFAGKLSYSIYLWHWPLITLYKANISPEPNKLEQLFLLLGSLVLGYLSWKFIENRYRHKNTSLEARKTYRYALLFSALFALIGFSFQISKGLPMRYSSEANFASSYIDYFVATDPTRDCFLYKTSDSFKDFDQNTCIAFDSKKKNYLLVGDSHAAHFYEPLKQVLPNNVSLSQATASGCRPTIAYIGEKRCTELNRWIFEDLIKNKKFDKIILSGYWKNWEANLVKETVQELEAFAGSILVFGPILTYDQASARLLALSYQNDVRSGLLKKARNYAEIKRSDIAFNKSVSKTSGNYISILDILCPEQNCRLITPKGIPIQYDYGHVTYDGGVLLMEEIIKQGAL